jgi:glycosyltransferase involved in cell wall biosynthesis
MKVLMVSKALVRGTYQRKLEEIARAGDVDLTAVAPPAWREGKASIAMEREFTRGYRLAVTPIALNGHYHVHFYPRLAPLLRAVRPDVVHVDEEPYNLATVLALRAARSVGARRLFFAWQNLNRRLPLPFALIEQASYRLANGAIAGVGDAKSVLREKGFRGPIWVIPQFGVDADLFRPASSPPDEFVVGFVGRLVPEKGVDLLLRACATLSRPWRLRLVGAGQERAALERLARDLDVADRVAFLGDVPSIEIPEILRGLSVLVLPSRSRPNWREQFGRALVEAMACAVPVVGASSGEIPRVIGDAGLTFPEGDWAVLADQLARLQDDAGGRSELGARARARVLSHFTHARIAEETVAAYRHDRDEFVRHFLDYV